MAVNISVYALAIIYLDQAHCCPEAPRTPLHFFNYWRIPTAEYSLAIHETSNPSSSIHRFSVQALSGQQQGDLLSPPLTPPPPTTGSILRSQPRKTPQSFISTMADIDMPDAEVGTSSKTKAPAKASKSGPSEAAGDGKKRFEVKKACLSEFHPRKSMF